MDGMATQTRYDSEAIQWAHTDEELEDFAERLDRGELAEERARTMRQYCDRIRASGRSAPPPGWPSAEAFIFSD